MNRQSVCGMIVLLLLVPACSSTRVATNPVAKGREAFVAAFNRGDAAALKQMYATDAVLLSFTGQMVKSSDTIATGLARASSVFDLDLSPVETRASRSLVAEAGAWRHRDKGTDHVRDTGTYLWVWRKHASGEWLIDMHAVNRSPQPPH